MKASKRELSLCDVMTGAPNVYVPGAHVFRSTPKPAEDTYHGAEFGWPPRSQL